jgi:hypothetical protein
MTEGVKPLGLATRREGLTPPRAREIGMAALADTAETMSLLGRR